MASMEPNSLGMRKENPMKTKNSERPLAMLLVLAGFGGVGAWGCGTDQEEGDPDVSVTQNNLCDEMAEVLCHNIFECCTGSQIEEDFGLEITTTKKTCRRDVALQCEEGNALLLYAISAGTVAIERDKANTCLKDLVVRDQCFMVIDEPTDRTACSEMIRGLQEEGKDCPMGFECAEDLYCAADGKCRKLPGKGEKCPSYACAKNLYCGYDGESSERKCLTLKKKGESCPSSLACEPPLYCEYGEDHTQGTCQSLKEVGEPCKASSECNSYKCIPGMCDNGQACFVGSDCQGQCASSGQPCNSSYDCAGVCEVSGDSCEDDFDCDYLESERCINEECKPGTCNGKPACGQRHYVIDYCELDPFSSSSSAGREEDFQESWE
jgi:hypothetical protein